MQTINRWKINFLIPNDWVKKKLGIGMCTLFLFAKATIGLASLIESQTSFQPIFCWFLHLFTHYVHIILQLQLHAKTLINIHAVE